QSRRGVLPQTVAAPSRQAVRAGDSRDLDHERSGPGESVLGSLPWGSHLQAVHPAFHGWLETRKLRTEELAALDSVKWAPVIIFQRLVSGLADLRVTIIGDRVMSAALDL